MNKQLVIGTFIGLLLTAAVGYYFFISKAIPPPAGAIRRTSTAADPVNLPTIDIAEDYSVHFSGRDDLIAHANSIQPHLTVEAWDNALKLNQFGQPIAFPRTTNDCSGLPPTSGLALPKSRIEALKQGKQNILAVPLSMPKCFVRDSSIAVVYDDIFENKMTYTPAGRLKLERILERRIDLLPDAFFTAIKTSRDEFPLLYNLGNATSTFQEPIVIMLVSYDSDSPVLPQDTLPDFAAGAEVVSTRHIYQFFARLTPKQRSDMVYVDTREPKYFAAGYPKVGNLVGINAPFIPSNPAQSKFRPDFLLADLAGSKVDLSQIPTDAKIPLVLIGHDEHDAGPLWVLRELRLSPHRGIIILREGVKGLIPVAQSMPATTDKPAVRNK
ncbi:MAG: hypothetical protein IPJ84_03940 [Bdellovibrionales bacterium]|nr:hypothetical protein [Bdellovibrionales bacterium]